MTPEQIAEDVLNPKWYGPPSGHGGGYTREERLKELIASAIDAAILKEREECAALLDAMASAEIMEAEAQRLRVAAAAIRARKP